MAVVSTAQNCERDRFGVAFVRTMKLRRKLRLSSVLLTLAAACAAAASGSLAVAGGLIVCAMIVTLAPFFPFASSGPADPEHLEAQVASLIQSLKLSQQTGAPRVAAVVTSAMVFIGNSADVGGWDSRYAVFFRDEIKAPIWREMVILLRHQSRPASEVGKVVENARMPLGKRGDL